MRWRNSSFNAPFRVQYDEELRKSPVLDRRQGGANDWPHLPSPCLVSVFIKSEPSYASASLVLCRVFNFTHAFFPNPAKLNAALHP